MAAAVQAFYETLRTSDVQLAARVPHSGKFLGVKAVQWIPYTTHLAVAYTSSLVIIWDAATGSQIQRIELEGGGSITMFQASPDYLFVSLLKYSAGASEHFLQIISLSGYSTHTLHFEERINALTVVPGTTKAYLGIQNTAIYQVDASDNTISENLIGPRPAKGWGNRMWFILEKDWVVHALDVPYSAVILVARISDATHVLSLEGCDHDISSIAYVTCARVFVTSGKVSLDNADCIRDPETLEIVRLFPADHKYLRELYGTDKVCGTVSEGLIVQSTMDWQGEFIVSTPQEIVRVGMVCPGYQDDNGFYYGNETNHSSFIDFSWSLELMCIAAATEDGRVKFVHVD